MDELTHDAFLGGKLHLWQPQKGYRAGTDPVFLAAACPAQTGESVLDIGCGVGTAVLCLAARVPGLRLFGLEVQPQIAALARRNAADNGFEMPVECGDLTAMPKSLRQHFDHVITNPPFYAQTGTPSPNGIRDLALRVDVPLFDWVQAAGRRLVPGGWLTLICGVDGLPQVLAAMGKQVGSVSVLPLAARENHPAKRIILRARKVGRAPFRLLAPFILHEGPAHDGDRNSHSARAEAISRHADSLSEEFR